MSRNFLVIDPEERPDVLHALASPQRVRILRLLHRNPGVNVNDIAEALELPQSTVSSNLQILEEAGLIRARERGKGGRACRKLCFSGLRRGSGDVSRQLQRIAGERDRSRDADRPLHQLRGQRALRALLAGGHHRTSRCSRDLPQSGPDECRTHVVHPGLCRVPVPQQCPHRRQDR